MEVHRLTKVIQNLRRTTLSDEASVSDGQLLAQFIEHQDEYAFAALVQRHSPMVWGVCRRIVAHHQDAEDAFQATFLVLARKASSIRPREMVANWLFGVAHRTALKAKTMAAKRYTREKQVTTMPEPEAAGQGSWGNLESLIDQELANLPDKYRIAIVLCDLEGKKGKDVARQLKIPEGTLASRLRTGRVLLAKRLARHGVALSGGALATVLSQNAASACAPTVLVSSTIKVATLTAAGKAAAAGVISANVAALMEGMVKSMLLNNLKVAMGVLLMAAVAVGGVGGLFCRTQAADQPHGQRATEKPESDKKGPQGPNDEMSKLQGTWRAVAAVNDGHEVGGKSPNINHRLVIDKTSLTIFAFTQIPTGKAIAHFTLDAKQRPKVIVLTWKKDPPFGGDAEFTQEAIYSLDGDTLKLCLSMDIDDLKAPTEFSSKAGSRRGLWTFNREPEDKEKPSAPKKETSQPEKGKAHRVTYPVADLVVPIGGLDVAPNSNKKEEGKTKEEWLIKKIIRTVSPASWEDSGGTGTIHYFPLGMALVVNNTPRVQAQVKYLLETMRRVQDVQVAAETRIISLKAASFLKLQELLPQLNKDGHAVLSDAETFALLRKAQDDADTKLVDAPKITFFPGQRVSFSMDPSKDLPGIKKTDVKLNALVAANLQHLELEVRATVGKTDFAKAMRLEDGVTLAQCKRNGDGYLIFLVTPRVILNMEEEVAAPEAESHRAAPPAADKARKNEEK